MLVSGVIVSSGDRGGCADPVGYVSSRMHGEGGMKGKKMSCDSELLSAWGRLGALLRRGKE